MLTSGLLRRRSRPLPAENRGGRMACDGATSVAAIIVNVAHPVTLIPGDGIGPEVAQATRRAVDAAGVAIEWECVDLNAEVIEREREVLPANVVASLARTCIGLKG